MKRTPTAPPNESFKLIGHSVPNRDGLAIVTGKAKYTGDITLPGMVYGRLIHSTVAHARIVRVDATEALQMEGVLLFIGPDDAAGLPLVTTASIFDMPVWASDRVRYAGEPVGAVIATSEEVAELAADAVTIEYEELPLVLDPEAALEPDAPLIHEGLEGIDGNACWRQNTKAGDIERAFQDADLVVKERFRTSKAHSMPMETHGAIASWDELSETLTVWSSTQHPHMLRGHISRVFDIPQSCIRVIKPFVGGSFGHKVGLKAHEATAILASRRLGRPVRILLTRKEEFISTVSRNPQIRDVEVALKRDGTVLGWREQIVQDVGAYSGLGPSVLALSEWVTVGPYRTPALDIEGVCVYTNKPPSSAYRGFGNPQATFTRELMFDICARTLEMDPVEFRRQNLIRAEDLPTETANGLKLSTLAIEETVNATLKAIDYENLRRTKRPHQGIGVVCMLEWGGGCRWWEGFDADMSSVAVTLNPDGSLLVTSDASDSGQGHATLFTQIAGDILGVDAHKVRVVLGDTAVAPYGFGSYASRTSVVHGTALQRACLELKAKLLDVASHHLEVDAEDLEISEGVIRIRGTESSVGVAEVASMIHFNRAALPPGMESGALAVSASYDAPCEVPDERGHGNFAANYTCSTTVALVEVDPATGKITLLDWASAEDVGRVLHPDLLDGQIQGGIAQGIGYALGEDLLFDETGTMLNPSMIDYQAPTAPIVPLLEKLIPIESFDPTHPLGMKGIGESGITPPAAAIACAVYDAIGVAITSLPLTPEKVLDAIAHRPT